MFIDPREFVVGVPGRHPVTMQLDCRPAMREYSNLLIGYLIHEIQAHANDNSARATVYRTARQADYNNPYARQIIHMALDYLEMMIFGAGQPAAQAIPTVAAEIAVITTAQVAYGNPGIMNAMDNDQRNTIAQVLQRMQQLQGQIEQYQMRIMQQQQGVQPLGIGGFNQAPQGYPQQPMMQPGYPQQPMMPQGYPQQPMMGADPRFGGQPQAMMGAPVVQGWQQPMGTYPGQMAVPNMPQSMAMGSDPNLRPGGMRGGPVTTPVDVKPVYEEAPMQAPTPAGIRPLLTARVAEPASIVIEPTPVAVPEPVPVEVVVAPSVVVEPVEAQQDVNTQMGVGTLYSARTHGRLILNNKILPLEEAVEYELHENEHLLKERRSGMRDLIPLAEVDRYYRDMAQVKAVDEILANLEKDKGALELSSDVTVTDAVLVDESMPEGPTLWAELMAWCDDRAVPVSPNTNVMLVTTYRHYGWSVPKTWDFMKTKPRTLDALHRELLKFSEEIAVFAWDDLCKELTMMANALLLGCYAQEFKCQDFMDDYVELKTLLADDVLKAFSKHMMTLIYDTLFIGKPSALHERLGIAPTVFTILPLEHVFILPVTAADLGLAAARAAAVVDDAVTPNLAASLQVYFNTRHTKHISRVRITTLDNQSLYVFNFPPGVCRVLSEHALRD